MKKLTKEVKLIKKSIKAEYRFLETDFGAVSIPTAPEIELANGMVQGDTPSTREGNQILMKSVHARGMIYGGDSTGNVVRVLLVYDKATDGSAPTDAEINQSTGTPSSQPNWYYRNRFKIIYDKRFTLETTVKPTVFTINKKLNLPTFYNAGNAGDVTDIIKGSLYWFIISDSGAVPNPAFTMYSRIVFTP